MTQSDRTGNTQMKIGTCLRRFAAFTCIGLATSVGAQQMATSGKIEVSDGGAALYEIPFALPPNTGGHEAALNLTYNSRAGNGLFGVGWSLKGLSAITRCSKNIAEEGLRKGVQNDSSDIYCLDGEKLRLVSGIYGGSGATYRTARDSYARITSYGAAGSGPQWFKVELRDGRILELGNTTDSRLEVASGSTVRAWMLSSASDRSPNGNRIAYTYEKNLTLGEQVLSSLQHNNGFVSIEYEARPADDPIVRYDAGMQHGSTTRRVKAVRLYSEPLVNGIRTRQMFKVYRLGYTQSGATRRSLLTSIRECASDAADAPCLPPTTIAYQNTGINDLTVASRSARAQGTPIDLQGNGQLQALYFPGREGIAPEAAPAGFSPTVFAVWDYNSDGRMDLEVTFERFNMESLHRILISNGQILGSAGNVVNAQGMHACRGDVDGDGATDAIRVSDSGADGMSLSLDSWVAGVLTNRAVSFTFQPTSDLILGMMANCPVVDLDGDGAADFVSQANTTLSGYTFTSSGPGSPVTMHRSFGQALGLRTTALYGDFNGDGKTDLLSRPTGGYVWFSNGRAFVAMGSLIPNVWGPRCVGDFNGDGRSDVFLSNTSELHLSSSNAFFSVPSGIPPGLGNGNGEVDPICADFDGDGRADIYFPHRGEIWSATTKGPVDYVSEVVTGVGQVARLTYKPLTDPTVYTKQTGAIYPQMELQTPTYVVSRVQNSDGRGGMAAVSYTYEGLRADLKRNGTLGFQKVRTLNEVSGIGIETTYRQDHPYLGLRAAMRKFKGTRTLDDTQFSYQSFDQTLQYARVHRTGVDSRAWDLDGSFVRRSRETFSDVDAYGNARAQTVEHLDEPGTTVVSRQALVHAYTNDSAQWLIGLLTGTTTNSRVSSASIPAALGTPDPPAPTQPPSSSPPPVSAWLQAILSLLLDD